MSNKDKMFAILIGSKEATLTNPQFFFLKETNPKLIFLEAFDRAVGADENRHALCLVGDVNM